MLEKLWLAEGTQGPVAYRTCTASIAWYQIHFIMISNCDRWAFRTKWSMGGRHKQKDNRVHEKAGKFVFLSHRLWFLFCSNCLDSASKTPKYVYRRVGKTLSHFHWITSALCWEIVGKLLKLTECQTFDCISGVIVVVPWNTAGRKHWFQAREEESRDWNFSQCLAHHFCLFIFSCPSGQWWGSSSWHAHLVQEFS